jgi:myo-inositol 2-dehydrogenase/D-chiro-inositol 1-dehydrogenase
MSKPESAGHSRGSRRDFLKTSTAVAMGTAMAGLAHVPAVHAAGSDVIKVGLVGCGGRGSGALENVLQSARGVQVVAIADYFKEKTDSCRSRVLRFAKEDKTTLELGNKVDLPEERCFHGIDGYQKVINAGVNYVILATPPGFRPQHLKAAVAAGKHIFTEKPVAVDGPGIRTCLAVC